ncbi:MAG: ISNCY family transposase, partial [Sodalis sp. (in: enterobacteria)]
LSYNYYTDTQVITMMNYLIQEGNAASPRTFITEIAKRAEKHEEALMTIAEALKQEGIQLGRQEGKLEVACQMLDGGMAPATVKRFTGLTDSDILKLKR